MKLQNKLLKQVDPDVYRKFRAYCIGEGLTMGRALSALMTGALHGAVNLTSDGQSVRATSRKHSWQWPAGKGSRDE